MASSVTPYGMPLIVAQRRPFTPTSGEKDWGSRLQERRECADVVNKIRPRAACKAALKGKWRDTTMHLIFPQSPGATEIQRGTGCSTAFFFFFLPNIHAPCPLTTPPWFFSGQMPFPLLLPLVQRKLMCPLHHHRAEP